MFQKEEVSRNKVVTRRQEVPEQAPREDYELEEEDDVQALQQLDDFDNMRLNLPHDSDSD